MVACILLFFNKLLWNHYKKRSISKKRPDYSDRLISHYSLSTLSLWSATILTPGILFYFRGCFFNQLTDQFIAAGICLV